MNLSNRSSRNGTLTLVIVVSVALHLIALIAFGAFKIVESFIREEKVFEAPPIAEMPQKRPQYVVNLERHKPNSAPPRPDPIAGDSPSIGATVPNIRTNAPSPSASDRDGGAGGIRELTLGKIDFLGKGIEGGNERIMFVIDISGGMAMGERDLDEYQLVVREVSKSLRAMQGTGSFNIVAFADETDLFRSSFTPPSEGRINAAESWLLDRDPSPRGVKVEGTDENPGRPERHQGSSAHLALKTAFAKRPGTIIFLSDGGPTGASAEEIFKLVEAAQSDPKIPIHTVSYKSGNGRAFLQELAERNGGEFTLVN